MMVESYIVGMKFNSSSNYLIKLKVSIFWPNCYQLDVITTSLFNNLTYISVYVLFIDMVVLHDKNYDIKI